MDKWARYFDRYFTAFSRVAAYSTSILVAAPFFYHLAHGSQAFLGLLEDDYFYYATIADRLVTLGKFTYDGSTLTNGFHPLWFAVVVMVRVLCGRFGAAFYVALTLIAIASMIATYELSRRFAMELGASPRLASGISVLYAFGTAQLLSTGMECVLAVPLFLWLLIEVARQKMPITPRRAARLGFIASLAILARLDIAMAVALMIVGFVVFVRLPLATLARILMAFCLGGLLLPIYFAANLSYFGSLLPTSAVAKRLVVSPGFNFRYAHLVARGTAYGRTVGILLPLGLIALCLLVRRGRGDWSAPRFAGAIAFVFAFVFFGFNALTGWTFFGWYAFPIASASIAALSFICECCPPFLRGSFGRAIALVLVALVPVSALRYYIDHGPRWTVPDNTLLAMTYELSDHMHGRDGLIAMGAIAGVVSYVMDRPVLQLEGIVGDHRLIEHVRNQDSLGDVLREYHADYLVVSLASERAQPNNGCYLISQPNPEWAGQRTAKMRGEICAEPIAHFFTEHGPNPWSDFPALETLVWDLHGARWREPDTADSAHSNKQ